MVRIIIEDLLNVRSLESSRYIVFDMIGIYAQSQQ